MTLDIALKPSKFIIIVIATNIKTIISKSMFGKYIKARLSANVLITNPEIVRKYTQTIMKRFCLRNKILP